MTDGRDNVRASDIMKALHDFVEEPTDDVAAIPIERIKAELAADGIDVLPHVHALKTRLAKLRVKHELDQAGQRHATLSEKVRAQTPIERIGEAGQRLFGNLLGGAPQPALQGGFFRKLTEAGDDTRQAFAEDVELVNELEADDGLGDDKNR